MKTILKFFDRLEDNIRAGLSHYPVLYAGLGSIGVILLWRGIWVLADEAALSGWASIFISVPLLLATGLFVSFFIGDQIILSGIKHEKKTTEKAEHEIQQEMELTKIIKHKLAAIDRRLEEIERQHPHVEEKK